MESTYVLIIMMIIIISSLSFRKSRVSYDSDEDAEKSKKMSKGEVIGHFIFLSIIFVTLLIFTLILYEYENPGNSITRLDIPWKKEQRVFGVKVLPYGGKYGYYQIVYTNNGFLTTENLNEYFEHSNEIQLWLGYKKDAVRIASTMTSYEQCLTFNRNVEKLQEPEETITFTSSEH